MAEGERFESEGSTEAKGEELEGRTERNSGNETNEEAKRGRSGRRERRDRVKSLFFVGRQSNHCNDLTQSPSVVVFATKNERIVKGEKRGEMVDDETESDRHPKRWREIVLPLLSWTFLSPFIFPHTYIPDMNSSEGETVMNHSHSSLHTPPPPLRFVLESNRTAQSQYERKPQTRRIT
jgi:hypothetical protein